MAKFFEGSRSLPGTLVKVDSADLTGATVSALIAKDGQNFALSLVMPGLPESSLGYIFFITKNHNKYQLSNITDVIFFRSLSLEGLVSTLKHASGIEYNDMVQKEFSRIRTEIGIDQ